MNTGFLLSRERQAWADVIMNKILELQEGIERDVEEIRNLIKRQ